MTKLKHWPRWQFRVASILVALTLLSSYFAAVRLLQVGASSPRSSVLTERWSTVLPAKLQRLHCTQDEIYVHTPGVLQVFDLSTGSERLRQVLQTNGPISISSEGRLIAQADGEAFTVKVLDGELSWRFEIEQEIVDLVISRNAKYILGLTQKSVHVWRLGASSPVKCYSAQFPPTDNPSAVFVGPKMLAVASSSYAWAEDQPISASELWVVNLESGNVESRRVSDIDAMITGATNMHPALVTLDGEQSLNSLRVPDLVSVGTFEFGETGWINALCWYGRDVAFATMEPVSGGENNAEVTVFGRVMLWSGGPGVVELVADREPIEALGCVGTTVVYCTANNLLRVLEPQ